MESAATPVFEVPPTSHSQAEIIRDGYNLIVDVLREPLHELHCTAEITPQFFVIFDVFPFAAGAQRLAFKGSIYERVSAGEPVFRVHVVVKMEMAIADSVERLESDRTRISAVEASKTIRKHDVATQYVDKWCRLGINKSVYVLSTEKLTITRGCTLQEIEQQKFPVLHQLFKKLSLDSVLYKDAIGTVEDYLPGRFTKFLNNDGMTNSLVNANFPAAFAHWTFVESGGEIMVSDIQGVRTGTGYILTDPCVHSVIDQDGYGVSDLGMVGVKEFFQKHRCNKLCNDLGLGRDDADLDLGHALRTRLIPKKGTGMSGEEWGTEANAVSVEEAALRPERKGVEGQLDQAKRALQEIEAKRAMEESEGKVQRRVTMRLAVKSGVEEMETRGRRRTIGGEEKEERKTGRSWGRVRSHNLQGKKNEEAKHALLSGIPSLFRLRRKTNG